ncbi:MAG: nucleotidyltransferase family protein [Lachnospiraceae bacterium]|nr:nucleotidyltransferase family protein [Lachnospiraceae bacterium]
MKVCGIIAEFNPLHKGHAALIEHAVKEHGCDGVIVIMSGDYMQRGEPAIADKYCRASMAISAGADLVLELPVLSATGSAQYFAEGAVSALKHCGVTDILLFGSESGDISFLKEAAARPHSTLPFEERMSSNDLLACEYLRALDRLDADVSPVPFKRLGPDHDSPVPGEGFASATYIREKLLSGEAAGEWLPTSSSAILKDYMKDRRLLSRADFSELIFYALLSHRDEGYARFFDIYEDLSDKLLRELENYEDADRFIARLKSKDITHSRLSRTLIHILLDLRKKDAEIFRHEYDSCPWLRILGVNRKNSALLHAVKENCDRPLISKTADAPSLLDERALALFEKDLSASFLYSKLSGRAVPDQRRSIITTPS